MGERVLETGNNGSTARPDFSVRAGRLRLTPAIFNEERQRLQQEARLLLEGENPIGNMRENFVNGRHE